MTAASPARPPKSFTVLATDGAARTGVLSTARGEIRTPAFMPVGTAGTVKALTVEQVAATGADVILGNTYHLMLRPGPERLARLGGLHRFMRWPGPILTDSGGFQVMSLGALTTLSEDGVTFASHIDGSRHALSPERSVETSGFMLRSEPSMGERNTTPSSLTFVSEANENTWKPPESVRIGFDQDIMRWRPPSTPSTSSPGRSHRW